MDKDEIILSMASFSAKDPWLPPNKNSVFLSRSNPNCFRPVSRVPLLISFLTGLPAKTHFFFTYDCASSNAMQTVFALSANQRVVTPG